MSGLGSSLEFKFSIMLNVAGVLKFPPSRRRGLCWTWYYITYSSDRRDMAGALMPVHQSSRHCEQRSHTKNWVLFFFFSLRSHRDVFSRSYGKFHDFCVSTVNCSHISPTSPSIIPGTESTESCCSYFSSGTHVLASVLLFYMFVTIVASPMIQPNSPKRFMSGTFVAASPGLSRKYKGQYCRGRYR